MKILIKLFNGFFLLIIAVLSAMSILALITIHWNLIKEYAFSFSPDSINNYLAFYGRYKELFSGTIATIGVYFGLISLKAAVDANYDKIKNDRFMEWKYVLDAHFPKIESLDPEMKRVFIKIRSKFFLELHDLNFIVSNKVALTSLIKNNFESSIATFETQNIRYANHGGYYPTENFSFSYESFNILLNCCISSSYEEFENDLKEIYITKLSEKRNINPLGYQLAEIKLNTFTTA